MKPNHIATAFGVLALLGILAIFRLPPFQSPERFGTSGNDEGISNVSHSADSDNPSSPRDARMRRVLKEPGDAIRHRLFLEFCDSLSAEDFPTVFDSLCDQLGYHNSYGYDYYQIMLERWIIVDTDGAWKRVRAWFDTTVPDRWTDSWEQKLIATKKPELLRKEGFWPTQDILSFFRSSLFQSPISVSEKMRIDGEFSKLFLEYFGPTVDFVADYEAGLPSPARQRAVERIKAKRAAEISRVRAIRSAAVEDLEGLAMQSAEAGDSIAQVLALRRLVESDPALAKHAMDLVAETVESMLASNYPVEEDGRKRNARFLTDQARSEILKRWAAANPDGLQTWLDSHELEARLEIGTYVYPFLDQETRKELEDLAQIDDPDGTGEYNYLMEEWGRQDPRAALESILASHGEIAYSQLAEGLADYATSPESKRELMQILDEIDVPLTTDDATYLMESMGDWNIPATAKFGVEWLVQSEEYPIEEITKVWRGEAAPNDGYPDDRTFGCLRCWALAQPDEMQAWIETVENVEVRKALQWLHDNPEGGEPEADE